MTEKKISMKKIAEEAGLSVATVSRVINNNGRFSAETKRRVEEIIESYNYEPDFFARGLRKNRATSIGVIVPDITNEFFSHLICSLQMELFKQNYNVVIYNTSESIEIEKKCLSNLRAQKVSGVVYINGHEGLEENYIKEIPTIYIDRQPQKNQRTNAVYISSDNVQGGYLATKELIKSGCKKIAVITERYNTYVTLQRLEGYRKACREAGLTIDTDLIFTPKEIRYKDGYNITKKLLEEKIDFDGLFCETDWLASGAQAALKDHQIEIPRTKKLVGFDDISISFLCQQPFTTIHQDTEMMGKFAASILLQMIEDEQPDEQVVLMPVSLVRRQTTCGSK